MPSTKTFFSHRQILHDSQDTEWPCLVLVHGFTFIMTSNVSFSSHSPHPVHVFSMHFFFSLKWCLWFSCYQYLAKWIISVVKSISFGSKVHRTLYLNVLSSPLGGSILGCPCIYKDFLGLDEMGYDREAKRHFLTAFLLSLAFLWNLVVATIVREPWVGRN